MVSTDPDSPQDGLQSPRRSVSESELCDMNDGDVATASYSLISGNDGSHQRSNEYHAPLTLPRFVSLRKKSKFKYANIDSKISKRRTHEDSGKEGSVGKKKSFVSKFVGRMRRHMSLFTISNTSTERRRDVPKTVPPVGSDHPDYAYDIRGSKSSLRRRERKKIAVRRNLSTSAHDIRQVAASLAQPYLKTNHHPNHSSHVEKKSPSPEHIRSSASTTPVCNKRNSVDDEPKIEKAESVKSQLDETNRVDVTQNHHNEPRTNHKPYSTPGLEGIRNHGNTCFMNAVIQCLSHTDILAEYFVSDHYKADMHRRYKLHTRRNSGTRGELTEQLALLLKSLWLCQYTPEVSANFISVVSKYGSQYRGNNQHDAQEFLLWLLDKVHEDLNTATKKRYKKPKNSHGRPDELVAAETLANHMRCNNSFVQDIFQAQFRSSLQCPTCNRQSNTFDPFRCISVPIPQKQTCAIFLIFVFMSSSSVLPPKQVKLGVSISVHATIKELREVLSTKTGVPSSQFVLTKLNSNGYFHDYNDHQHISDIRHEKSVYAIETCTPNNKQDSEPLNLVWFNCVGADCLRFGYVYSHEISREAKYADIKNTILEKMSSEIKDEAINQNIPMKIRVLDSASRKGLLDTDVDHPLYMPIVDKALGLYELEGTGPKHLKLMIEWSSESANQIIITDEGKVDIDDSVKDLEYKNDKPNAVSLDDCFQLYTQEEKLGPENAWMCPHCHKLQQGVKKLSLWSIPDILVLHLKRFRQVSSQHTKLDTLVDFPLTGLDMAPNTVYHNYNNNYHNFNNNHHNQLTYWSPWKRHKGTLSKATESVYDLHAVCNHHGTIQGGHYTAICKNPINNKWYKFNDTKLQPIDDWRNIVTPSAYLLFYHRRNLVSLSGSLTSSSSVSSVCSSSNSSSEHWIFRIPSPKFMPPKVTKSEDNLLDLADEDVEEKKEKSSDLGNRTFHRGNRAYATLAPTSNKHLNSSNVNGETEHHSDDELTTSSYKIMKHSPYMKAKQLDKNSSSPSLNVPSKKVTNGAEMNSSDEVDSSKENMIPYSIVESCV